MLDPTLARTILSGTSICFEQLKKRGNRKNPTVGVQFATHQHNINDLEKCARMCTEIGVDYLSIKPVFNRGSGGDRIEEKH